MKRQQYDEQLAMMMMATAEYNNSFVAIERAHLGKVLLAGAITIAATSGPLVLQGVPMVLTGVPVAGAMAFVMLFEKPEPPPLLEIAIDDNGIQVETDEQETVREAPAGTVDLLGHYVNRMTANRIVVRGQLGEVFANSKHVWYMVTPSQGEPYKNEHRWGIDGAELVKDMIASGWLESVSNNQKRFTGVGLDAVKTATLSHSPTPV